MRNTRSIGGSFYVWFAFLAVTAYLIHEAAHWLVGATLGYPVSYGINSVISASPMTAGDHMLMSAAGPAVTIVTALIGFYFVMRRESLIGYAVLYFALFMRVIAAGVSVLNLNDEARISDMLGFGPWLLPGLVVVVLLVPTVIASRHLRLSWKVNMFAYVVSSIVAAAVVGLDMVHRGTV